MINQFVVILEAFYLNNYIIINNVSITDYLGT